jgi:hypothetical protein
MPVFKKRRDDTLPAQVIEEPRKHIFGIDAVVEAGTPGLDRAGDIVEPRAKDEVAESPGHHLLIGRRRRSSAASAGDRPRGPAF